MTWVTFTTESLGKPVRRLVNRTLPGTPAMRRFVVKATTMTVLKAEWVNTLDWSTTTGLL